MDLFERLLEVKHERLDSDAVGRIIRSFKEDYKLSMGDFKMRFIDRLITIRYTEIRYISGYITNGKIITIMGVSCTSDGHSIVNRSFWVRDDIIDALDALMTNDREYASDRTLSNECMVRKLDSYGYALTFASFLPTSTKSARS